MNLHLLLLRPDRRPFRLCVPEILLWSLLLLALAPPAELLALRALLLGGRRRRRQATLPFRALGLVARARGLLVEIDDGRTGFRLAFQD